MPYIKYITIYLLWLAIIGLSVFEIVPGFVGFIGFVGFLATSARDIDKKNILTIKSWSFFWSSTIVFLSIVILHSIIYFFYKSTPLSILLTFSAIAGIIIAISIIVETNKSESCFRDKLRKFFCKEKPSYIDFLSILIFILQTVLYLKAQSRATEDALASPWPAFGYRYFIAYLTATFLLIYYSLKTKYEKLGLILIGSHFFLTFNIITAIYPLGFGYDPFLHRASEYHIFKYGFVEPKTPFYLAQYSIVNILAHITHLPIKLIDIYLVPLLSSFLIPTCTFFGLKYGLKIKQEYARLGTICALIYPLGTMVVTTPHNLSTLFIFCAVFLTLLLLQSRKHWLLPTTFAIASTLAHPLAGIFAFWLVISILLLPRKTVRIFKKEQTHKIIFYFFLSFGAIIVPLFFFLYNFIGNGVVNIADSLSLDQFISLFKKPYYFIDRPAHFIYSAIYIYKDLLIPALIILGLIGFRFYPRKRMLVYPAISIAIIMNIFIITTFLVFKNLNNFEQVQYAQRLLHVSVYFILPIAIYGLLRVISILNSKFKIRKIVIASILAIFLTSSFYLTYPQRNPKVHFPGYNVTQSDYKVAKLIHDNSPSEKKYVVLSTILTAAASIEKYGFETYYDTPAGKQFYYSIPSGSPLSELFYKMVYEGQKRKFALEAMKMTGADMAYFVIPDYWHNYDEITKGAKQSADGIFPIDNGKITVFIYYK